MPDVTLASQRLGHRHVWGHAYDEGIMVLWMDYGAPGPPRVLGFWSVADTWRTFDPPEDAELWIEEASDVVLSRKVKRVFWKALRDIWLAELPALRAAAEAPDATEEDLDTVRRGTVYLTLAANGLREPDSVLGKTITRLSEGWTGTGAQLVDAARLLLKDDGTPAAT